MRIAILLVLAGCIDDRLVPCGELACGVGFVCTPGGCASPDSATACAGHSDGDACMYAAIAGTCAGGSCHAHACGNGIIDRAWGEVCDDGNQISGDGCSADCRSTEICGNSYVDTIKGEQCDDGNFVSGDGCTSRCSIEFDVWRDATPVDPPGRLAGGLAVAPGNRVIELGGTQDLSSSPTLVGTWEFNGDTWERHRLAAELPLREGFGITYDVARGRTVLFGGVNGTGAIIAETWEWDGVSWMKRNPASSPSPRRNVALAYDEVRHRTVLFGGSAGFAVGGDTWEWDGTNWSKATTMSPPAPRFGAALAYDANLRRVVLYGGTDGTNNYTDTWEWDGTTWQQRTAAMFAASSAALAYDRTAQQLVLFTNSAATWTRSGATWTQQNPAHIPALVGPEMATDPVRGGVVIGGGFLSGTGFVDSDTYRWNGTDWTKVGTAAPTAMSVACYDAGRGVLVGFGEGLWEWDGAAWLERPLAALLAREATAIVFDAARGVAVAFGGHAGSFAFGDTATWDGTTWSTQHPAQAPSARWSHAMAYDAARGIAVMFGGTNGSTKLNDTWAWDGVTWSPIAGAGPSARAGHAMAYDPIRNTIVLFGGGGTAETWEWDGSWSQATPTTSPPARDGAAMAYDPLRRRVTLLGGTNPLQNDVWEWDGTTWTQRLPVLATGPRYAPVVAADATGGLVLFSGNSFFAQDTATSRLHFESSVVPPERCLVATEDSDGDGLAGCADPDCWARCTPLCSPGVTCDPNAPHCGDGACGAVEDYLICPEDCPVPSP